MTYVYKKYIFTQNKEKLRKFECPDLTEMT